MQLYLDQGHAAADYVHERTGFAFADVRGIVALNNIGEIEGAVVFTNYTGFSVMISGAGRAIMLRSFRQAIGDYVFGFLGCRRMEIVTRQNNKRMKKLAPRLGFRFEGRMRGYYGDADGYLYAILNDEAVKLGHWLPSPIEAREAA